MRRLVMVPILASVLILGACGGGSADETAEPAAAGAQGANTEFTAFRQCLSEHGVDLPEGGQGGGFPGGGERPSGMSTAPPSGFPTDRPSGAPSDFPSGAPGQGGPGGGRGMRVPDGVDEATWQAAQGACSSLMPSRPDGFPGAPGQNGGSEGSAPTASSASQYAVFWQCMADHDVPAPASGLPADLDRSDATVTAALDTCDALLRAS